ncbi:hypothetical protein L7F22_008752 [Adiantum nelumboides]|nr:hypothetical protein [Adiantum nelumboides]
MCLELKTSANFIVNLKRREPDKDHESSPEAVDDQTRAATKRFEGRADVDSDVDEEANGCAVEVEIISTVKETVEAEVVSTPPRSPQQQEADVQQMIEIEAVSNVKRRLEFEKPTEQVTERDEEAQEAQRSPSPPAEDVVMVAAPEAVPIAGVEVQQAKRPPSPKPAEDVVMAASPEAVPTAEAEEIQFLPNAAMEFFVPEEALKAAQQSDSFEEVQSKGLDFLADSKEAENGAIASNGALSYNSSYDTESEHFGKFMEDKSGWASRTSLHWAVALYLKEKFEARDMDEQRRLSLDSIVKGRGRKEAARMFFEILVLRSKDFIKVEQHDGVSEILIHPTDCLMKGSW